MSRLVRRVLLVDGQHEGREICAAQLRKAGYEVDTARGAIEALQLAKLRRPDAVVCALALEEVGGFAFCIRLHSEASMADVPVVLVGDQEASHQRRLASMVGAFALVCRSPTGSVELDAVKSSLREAH